MHEIEGLSVYRELIKASAGSSSSIRALDIQLGRLLAGLSPEQADEVLLATTLASAAIGQGHSCLPLSQASNIVSSLPGEQLSKLSDTESSLHASPVVGRKDEIAPLILDQQQLYLYRYYRYEIDIADALLQRAAITLKVDTRRAATVLKQLAQSGNPDAGQQHAAALALLKPLLIISGGPGTGKTYTLAYTLALLQALASKPLKIALAAPTGKAAARMTASIQSAKNRLPDGYAEHVPGEAQTLHRLLGFRPGAVDFSYNATRPLQIDLLVVDEASMIDLVMMDGLLRALPADCRLILLGDHHQLPSVDAGNVFADLCNKNGIQHSDQTQESLRAMNACSDCPEPSSSTNPIDDCFALLSTNHRQAGIAGLSTVAQAVDRGDMQAIDKLSGGELSSEEQQSVEITYPENQGRVTWLQEKILDNYIAMHTAPSMQQAFDIMERIRFLCAVREGSSGVEGINRHAEQLLRREGLIHISQTHYRGKPIIIRNNQYRLRLFNGDSGMLWEDEQGELKAWFKNQDNEFRAFPIVRLPAFDCAYAITIHQAQGSEFERVVMLLPEDDNRVLSRELIYTGVTRARKHLAMFCDRKMLESAISRQTLRYSGLRGMLAAS